MKNNGVKKEWENFKLDFNEVIFVYIGNVYCKI